MSIGNGGTLTGSGNINVTGSLSWLAGTMAGTGKTMIAAGSLAKLGMGLPMGNNTLTLSRTLDNSGKVVLWRNGSQGATSSFSTGGVLNNLPGGVFDIAYQEVFTGGFSGSGAFNNAGTMNVSAGTAPFNLNAVPLNNTGVINVYSGGLQGSINNSGVMNVYAGNTGASTNSGTVNYYNSASITAGANTGTLRVIAGTLTIGDARGIGGEIQVAAGAGASLNSSGGALQSATVIVKGAGDVALADYSKATHAFAGALQNLGAVNINGTVNIAADQTIAGKLIMPSAVTLTGAGNIHVNGGTISGTGKLTLGPSSFTELTGPIQYLMRNVENAGDFRVVRWGSNSLSFDHSTFTNLPTGVVTIADNVIANWGGSGFPGSSAFINQGTLRLVDDPWFSLSSITAVTNSGVIDVALGTVQFFGGYTHAGGRLILGGGMFATSNGINLQGGSIEGRGNITSSITSHGVIRPEGQLNVGALTLAADSQTEFELGGTTIATQYDTIVASGAALTLGGNLVVSFKNDFEQSIAPTDTFQLLRNSTSLIGDFANVANGQRLLTADGLGSFIVHYGVDSTMDPLAVMLSGFQPLLAGDFDFDGDVDGADFVAWQTNYPTTSGATLEDSDANGDGKIDGADFAAWQAGFPNGSPPGGPTPGSSPVAEPSTILLALLALAAAYPIRRRLQSTS